MKKFLKDKIVSDCELFDLSKLRSPKIYLEQSAKIYQTGTYIFKDLNIRNYEDRFYSSILEKKDKILPVLEKEIKLKFLQMEIPSSMEKYE